MLTLNWLPHGSNTLGSWHLRVFRTCHERGDPTTEGLQDGAYIRFEGSLLQRIYDLRAVVPELSDDPEHNAEQAEVPGKDETVRDLPNYSGPEGLRPLSGRL